MFGWETAFGLGALALLMTLAYGVYHTRHASRRAERAAEAGVRRLYDDPRESDAPPAGARRRSVPLLIWLMAGFFAVWLITISAMQVTGAVNVDPMGGPAPASTR